MGEEAIKSLGRKRFMRGALFVRRNLLRIRECYHAQRRSRPVTMKNPILFLFVPTLAFISSTLFGASVPKHAIDLDRGWHFRLAPDSALNHVAGVEPEVDPATLQRVADWTPAEVPGCIQTGLLGNKLIAEPF